MHPLFLDSCFIFQISAWHYFVPWPVSLKATPLIVFLIKQSCSFRKGIAWMTLAYCSTLLWVFFCTISYINSISRLTQIFVNHPPLIFSSLVPITLSTYISDNNTVICFKCLIFLLLLSYHTNCIRKKIKSNSLPQAQQICVFECLLPDSKAWSIKMC